VEEERIKSAFELAMERISALPDLTPEEIAAQKEKQFGPMGEALAAKYLGGRMDEDDLPTQFGKLSAEQGPIVRRAFIGSLCRTLKLEADSRPADRAFAGLLRLFPAKAAAIGNSAEAYRLITSEFEREHARQSAGIETAALKILGISGTAVRCNPAENPHWLRETEKLRQSCEPRLAAVRATLLEDLQKS
jgi:hypothetical protein